MRFEKAMLCAGLALAAGMATAAEPEFDWLAGHWCGGSADRTIDEVWLPEAGGALLGMSRTVREGKTESFEFMRIVPAGEDAGLHVQPNGMAATVFAVTERGVQRARFGVMPAWSERLSEADIRAVATYVHGLGGGE